jgi:DNA-binding response OmpR family regulator
MSENSPAEYLYPATVEEAVATLTRWAGEARLIAGGTDVLPDLDKKKIQPRCLVDISRIPDLAEIRIFEDAVEVGAAVTFAAIKDHPTSSNTFTPWRRAARSVGPRASRTRHLGGQPDAGHAAADGAVAAHLRWTLKPRSRFQSQSTLSNLRRTTVRPTILSECRAVETLFRGPGISAIDSTRQMVTHLRFLHRPLGDSLDAHRAAAIVDAADPELCGQSSADSSAANRSNGPDCPGAVAPHPFRRGRLNNSWRAAGHAATLAQAAQLVLAESNLPEQPDASVARLPAGDYPNNCGAGIAAWSNAPWGSVVRYHLLTCHFRVKFHLLTQTDCLVCYPGITMATILVVEDEIALREALAYNLQRQQYTVEAVGDGNAAVQAARRLHPDLIVLDLMLPGLDGFEVCRVLRQEMNVSIIMLTARDDEVDRVIGLELGADDYITKPFSMREFLARVKAHLRRERLIRDELATTVDADFKEILQFGNLLIDLNRREIKFAGRPLALKPKEFDLLLFLARHAAEALARLFARSASGVGNSAATADGDVTSAGCARKSKTTVLTLPASSPSAALSIASKAENRQLASRAPPDKITYPSPTITIYNPQSTILLCSTRSAGVSPFCMCC